MGVTIGLVSDAAILRRLDAHMERGNEHMARGNELIEQIREDGRRNAETWASTKDVLRELVLDIRESRRELSYEFRLQREGLQSVVEGMQRMVDEMRRRDDDR